MSKRKCTNKIIDDENDEWIVDQNNLDADTSTEDFTDKTQNERSSKKKSKDKIPNISDGEVDLEEIGLNSTGYDPKETLRISTKIKRSNHPIWNVFGILHNKHDGKPSLKGKDRIFCIKCFDQEETKLKGYASTTSTTVLSQHVLNIHKIDVKTHQKVEKQKKLSEIFLQQKKPSSVTTTKDEKFILARRLVIWFCRDLLPFCTVENEGFSNFWKSLNHSIQLPSRTNVSVNALDDMYMVLKENLLLESKNSPEHCAITSDAWTDNYVHLSYSTYTHHYIDENWQLKHRVLKTGMSDGRHTAENIRDQFNATKQEFGLTNKKIVCVTDSAANMKKAVRLLGLRHVPCIAHSVNLLVQKDLMMDPSMQPLRDILTKIRKTQKKLIYKHSELKKLHEQDQQKKLFLFIDEVCEIEEAMNADLQFGSANDTDGDNSQQFSSAADAGAFTGLKSLSMVRWCCIYRLIKCFLEHISIIRKILEETENYDLILNRNEIDLLHGLCNILEVFNIFTKSIQAQEYPTMNVMALFYTEILDSLDKMNVFTEDAVLLKAISILKTNLSKRFPVTDLMIASAILDPRVHGLPIIREYLTDNGLTEVQLMRKIISDFEIDISSSDDRDEPDTQTVPVDAARSSLMNILLSKHLRSSTFEASSLDEEMSKFLIQKHNEDDVLHFWKNNASAFPRLAAVAKVLLSIPATSAKAESAFSVAGCLIRSRRASIAPHKVQKVLFIHDNYDLLKF